MKSLKSYGLVALSLILFTLTTAGFAITPVGWSGILSTEWVVDVDTYDKSHATVTDLTLINTVPKCQVSPGHLVLDVYIIIYDNNERPLYYGVVKELTPRDIATIDLFRILFGQMGITGKGTVAMLPLRSGTPPSQAEMPQPGDALDGYLTQKVYTVTSSGLGKLVSISKTGFLGTAFYREVGITDPLCEFRDPGIMWQAIPNN